MLARRLVHPRPPDRFGHSACAANDHAFGDRQRVAGQFQALDIKGLGHERLLAEKEQIATTVRCTAVDAPGNRASGDFTVTVTLVESTARLGRFVALSIGLTVRLMNTRRCDKRDRWS